MPLYFPEGKTKKILLIKLFGVGNIFLMFSSIAMLKAKFSDSVIHLVTISSNKGIAEHTELISSALYIRDDSFAHCLKDFFSIAAKIRKENYDLVIDFEQFISLSSILSFFTGAFSIGFKNSSSCRHLLYSRTVDYREDRHMEDIFKTLLSALGCQPGKTERIGFNLEAQEGRVREILRQKKIYPGTDFIIIMHPGSSLNFKKRRWPVENFAILSRMILGKLDIKLVFTGKGAQEAELIKGIIDGSPSDRSINACDLLNLEEFSALIKMSNLVITNDTAPVQMASVLNTPCFSIFGPNTPFLYGPRSDNSKFFYKDFSCSPCMTNFNSKEGNCDNPECMDKICAEEVFEQVESYYSRLKK